MGQHDDPRAGGPPRGAWTPPAAPPTAPPTVWPGAAGPDDPVATAPVPPPVAPPLGSTPATPGVPAGSAPLGTPVPVPSSAAPGGAVPGWLGVLLVLAGLVVALSPLLGWFRLDVVVEEMPAAEGSLTVTGWGTVDGEGVWQYVGEVDGAYTGWIIGQIPDGVVVTLLGAALGAMGVALARGGSRPGRHAATALRVGVAAVATGVVGVAWVWVSYMEVDDTLDRMVELTAGSSSFAEEVRDAISLRGGPGMTVAAAGFVGAAVVGGLVVAAALGARRHQPTSPLAVARAGPAAGAWPPPDAALPGPGIVGTAPVDAGPGGTAPVAPSGAWASPGTAPPQPAAPGAWARPSPPAAPPVPGSAGTVEPSARATGPPGGVDGRAPAAPDSLEEALRPLPWAVVHDLQDGSQR